MCGLAGGISSFLTANERDIIGDLIHLNMFRGAHSTGMFDFVPHTGKLPKKEKHKTMFWKTTRHPFMFRHNEFSDAEKDRWEKQSPKLIAGHTRFATTGKINENNAHPFVHKNIVGMHNGTILGDFKNRSKFDTDSEALYYNIATMGFEKAINEIQKNNPAYALVWIDTERETLNFYRNDKRPLYFTMASDKGTTAFWSSDRETLEFVNFVNKNTNWIIRPFLVNQIYTMPLKESFEIKVKTFVPEKPAYTGSFVGGQYGGMYNRDPKYSTSAFMLQYGIKEPDGFRKEKDEISGLYFSPYQIGEIREAREREAKAKEEADAKKATGAELNDPPFDPPDKTKDGTKQTTLSLSGGRTASVSGTTDEPAKYYNKRLGRWEFFDDATSTWVSELEWKRRRSLRQTSKRARGLSQIVGPENTDDKVTSRIDNSEVEEHFTHQINYRPATEGAWRKATGAGCTWCGDPVSEEQELLWLDNNQFMCEGCTHEYLSGNTTVVKEVNMFFDEGKIEHAVKKLSAHKQLKKLDPDGCQVN